MIEPPPSSLEQLIASETRAPVTSHAAQAAVRAKLDKTLGIAAATTTTIATAKVASANAATAATAGGVAVKTAVALKVVGVVLAVGTVATTVVVTREPAHRAPAPIVERTPRPAPVPQPSLRVEPIDDAPTEDVTPEPIVAPPASEPPRKRAKLAASPPLQRVEAPARSQSQLLADASRALSLGDAAHALELLDEDTQLHREGPLGEERDALRISALAALGRTSEARDVARRLLATYPNSIHRRLAERVLAKETP
jgi:hypothetical protein